VACQHMAKRLPTERQIGLMLRSSFFGDFLQIVIARQGRTLVNMQTDMARGRALTTPDVRTADHAPCRFRTIQVRPRP
jgi:hypothetical protein